MNEGIVYWRSKVTGKIGHGNITKYFTNRGIYVTMITDHYFIPVSLQIMKIFNQE